MSSPEVVKLAAPSIFVKPVYTKPSATLMAFVPAPLWAVQPLFVSVLPVAYLKSSVNNWANNEAESKNKKVVSSVFSIVFEVFFTNIAR